MIITGKTLAEQPIRIYTEAGIISQVEPIATTDTTSLPYIAPGLIDLQVNGFAGVDFNTLPLTKSGITHATEQMLSFGVTGYYPTIITNSDDNICQLFSDFQQFKRNDAQLAQTLLGFHLEGPFISPNDGPRGAHNRDYVQAPNVSLVQKWYDASEGQLSILTLSPEWEDGLQETIEYCVAMGIKVSIGHSAATPDQIQQATQLGATMSTHLGNGCDLQIHRHHNYIWQQLAEDQLWTAIIADGFHLPPAVIKVILKAKQDQVILTSDTTAFGGMKPGRYQTHIGGDVILTEQGKLHLASNPELLAGSAKSVLDCINYLINSDLLSANSAWNKASYSPSSFMGLKNRGSLEVGQRADIVMLNKNDNGLSVLQTILAGEAVYTA
ncbi:N-acetylglucosamine-6-phosphate deacetylase [Photobacterium kishitanii]|uniref:N-acetylglucosamine-6-phosphate deacetylase n=1 Tax=Photobacterium kishitanii TaxID=318456 RepID=UPI000D17D4DE|nr:amidohydrolase family protein [Photobacterium kishitanii]PSW60863.1 N-acetylglucosamine-6-phosphate deacetylase [Photobacterium kishitanii]